jgi:ubiquitin C-terminal hydrolase
MSSNSAQRLSLSSFQLADLLNRIGLTNEQSANFMTLSGCRTVDNLCWLSEALIKYWVPETCILALYGLRYITMCSKDLSELSDINSDKAILYYQSKQPRHGLYNELSTPHMPISESIFHTRKHDHETCPSRKQWRSNGNSWFHRPPNIDSCQCDANPLCLVSIGIFPPRTMTFAECISGRSRRKSVICAMDVIRNYIAVSIVPHLQVMNAEMPSESNAETLLERLRQFHDPMVYTEEQTSEQDNTIQIALPPGIYNLGATCYLNCQLQSLFSIITFRRMVLQWTTPTNGDNNDESNITARTNGDNDDDSNGGNGYNYNIRLAMLELQKIFLTMLTGCASVIDIKNFANILQINVDRQEDPTEFTERFLQKIQQYFLECDRNSAVIQEIYESTLVISTQCNECGRISSRNDNMLQLNLHIPSGNCKTPDVQQLYDSLFRQETLSGRNLYECESCKKKTKATQTTKISKAPPVLNLHLIRYKCGKNQAPKKITKTVNLSKFLEVTEDIDGGQTLKKNYTLCSAVSLSVNFY